MKYTETDDETMSFEMWHNDSHTDVAGESTETVSAEIEGGPGIPKPGRHGTPMKNRAAVPVDGERFKK